MTHLRQGASDRQTVDKINEISARTDFITPESSDIEQAFKQACKGGVLTLTQGKTYFISQSLDNECTGDMVIEGNRATIKVGSPYAITSGQSNSVIRITSNGYSVTIKNVKIDGNNTTLNYSDWTNFIYGVEVLGSPKKVTYENIEVVDSSSIGLRVKGSSKVLISDCTVTASMFHPINTEDCGYVNILSNKVSSLGTAGGTNVTVGGIGILATDCDKLRINNNDVFDTSDTGIKAEGCNDVVIRDNNVVDVGKDGIKVQFSTDVSSVTNAVIEGNTVNGILATRTDGSAGILVSNTVGFKISGNVVENTSGSNRYGIRTINASGTKSSNGIISGNIVKQCSDGSFSSINIVGDGTGGRFKVTENLCEDDIYVGLSVGHVLVSKNTINPDFTATIKSYTGIIVFQPESCTITDNAVHNMSTGIIIQPSDDYSTFSAIVSNNIVYNANARGLQVRSYSATNTLNAQLNIIGNKFVNLSSAAEAIKIGLDLIEFKHLNIIGNTGTGSFSIDVNYSPTGNTIDHINFSGNSFEDSITEANHYDYGTNVTGPTITGTFLPELWDSTLATDPTPPTYIYQRGTYQRNGDRVTIQVYIQISSLGGLTAGDPIHIGNLPYTSTSAGQQYAAFAVGFASNMSLPGQYALNAYMITNVDYIYLRVCDNVTGGTGMLVSEFSATGQIVVSGTYKIA